MRLTWLADVARLAGLTVIEEPGWRTRGDEFHYAISGVIGHHTASARTAGDAPSVPIVIHGRPDLDGPLCQYLLARSGAVHVIASGIANHAGRGVWPHFRGNADTIGIEAENNGLGTEPWSAQQIDAYLRLVHAILIEIEQEDAKRFCAHYEWAQPVGRKPDPRGAWENGGDWYSGRRWEWGHYEASANLFRARLQALIEGDEEMWTPEERQTILDGANAALYNRHLLDDIIRPKIDQTWAALYATDHAELPAGQLVEIERTVHQIEIDIASLTS